MVNLNKSRKGNLTNILLFTFLSLFFVIFMLSMLYIDQIATDVATDYINDNGNQRAKDNITPGEYGLSGYQSFFNVAYAAVFIVFVIYSLVSSYKIKIPAWQGFINLFGIFFVLVVIWYLSKIKDSILGMEMFSNVALNLPVVMWFFSYGGVIALILGVVCLVLQALPKKVAGDQNTIYG